MKVECKHIPRPDEFSFENNDCAVRAISKAFGMTYPAAHKMLQVWGRRKGKGIQLNQFMFNNPIINGIRHERKGPFLTITQFVKKHPKGTYLCRKAGHAFTIIDGVVYGEHKLRSIITDAWAVTGWPEQKPTVLRVNKKPTQAERCIALKGKTVDEVVELTGIKKANVQWYFSKYKLHTK